jgi:hypothetical protein
MYANVLLSRSLLKLVRLQYLRFISATSILSRLFDFLLLTTSLSQVLPKPLFINQFAFSPTGIPLQRQLNFYHMTGLRKDNSFARCIFINYSPAFGTINHELLACKSMLSNLPAVITNRLTNFLTGRSQAATVDGKIPSWLPITQSIVHGLGNGPCLYIIYVSDLKPLSQSNQLREYTGDTTVYRPENTVISVELTHAFSLVSSKQIN